MPYVYPLTNQPLPPELAATVVRVPPGISDRYPLGGYFTEDGVQVTKLPDPSAHPFGATLQNQQPAGAYSKVDLIQELRDQLNRIEESLKKA